MDGRGQAYDNIFVERAFGDRSNTNTEVYLHQYPCESVAEARKGLDKYSVFYNTRRGDT